MDDSNGNIVYYLVLGAIYILSRVFGKKKKKPAPQKQKKRQIAPPTAENEEAAPPPLSFEDILRELSGTTQPKPEPVSAPEPEPIIEEPVYSMDAIDEIAVDYKVPETIGYNKHRKPKSVSSTRDQDEFIRDDSYKIKEKRTVDYLSLLQEVDGPAKAFVLSEIFNKKY